MNIMYKLNILCCKHVLRVCVRVHVCLPVLAGSMINVYHLLCKFSTLVLFFVDLAYVFS